MFLDSGKFFGFWDVFWILGRVLDSGKCFGTYELSRILAPYGDMKRRDTRRQHEKRNFVFSSGHVMLECSIYYIFTKEIPNHFSIIFCCERCDLSRSHSNGDL